MPDIKGAVTKKIGPLPLWGWVVAGAGAVFVFSRFRGGSSAGDANAIRIPTFAPGNPSDVGGGAVGSPGQNVIGGDNPQPVGVVPWWSTPPAWWGVGPGGGVNTAAGSQPPPGSPPQIQLGGVYSKAPPLTDSGGGYYGVPGSKNPLQIVVGKNKNEATGVTIPGVKGATQGLLPADAARQAAVDNTPAQQATTKKEIAAGNIGANSIFYGIFGGVPVYGPPR